MVHLVCLEHGLFVWYDLPKSLQNRNRDDHPADAHARIVYIDLLLVFSKTSKIILFSEQTKQYVVLDGEFLDIFLLKSICLDFVQYPRRYLEVM